MQDDAALRGALCAAIAGLPGPGTAGLAALDAELRLMLQREPADGAAAHILLTAQAALAEARATRH